jgi:hypothetical protein
MPDQSVGTSRDTSGRTTAPGTRPRPNPIRRRQWLHTLALDRRLTAGAKAWLMLLASRSSDDGKPVWGLQTKQAQAIGRSDRSVRRYRDEAEHLGYVRCYRSNPERGPDGTYGRRKTNRYYLCSPTPSQAPRARPRASYCVLKRRCDLPDSNGRWNPSEVSETPAHLGRALFASQDVPQQMTDDALRATKDGLRAAREALAGARGR